MSDMSNELNHAIVMLLLLTGLLNARPRNAAWAQAAVAAGIGLALIAPPKRIELPFEWLAGILIPLLLWQSAHGIAHAQRRARAGDLALWAAAAAAIGLMLHLMGGPSGPGAFLFGVLTASMMWRITESVESPGGPTRHLAEIGMLALTFLLVDIPPVLEAPERRLLGVLGGAGIGALMGYLSVNVALEWTTGRWRAGWHVAQAYLAYGAGALLGLSEVSAAIFSIAVYLSYGTRRGLWPTGRIAPRPLDAAPGFILGAAVLALLGWQFHAPLTARLLIEALLGTAIAIAGLMLGRRFNSFAAGSSYARGAVPVGLLLISALLLWPRDALLYPTPLAVALLLAAAAGIGAQEALSPLLKLYAYLDEAEKEEPAQHLLPDGPLIRDAMSRDVVTVSVDTPAQEVARLFSQRSLACIPVMERDGRLAGVVTGKDLFVKNERLRRAGLSFPAVFKEQVTLEELPEAYATIAALHVAGDFMTRDVIWIRETRPLAEALELMVRMGVKRIPVLAAGRGNRELTGLVTRRDLIRFFLRDERP